MQCPFCSPFQLTSNDKSEVSSISLQEFLFNLALVLFGFVVMGMFCKFSLKASQIHVYSKYIIYIVVVKNLTQKFYDYKIQN